MGRRLNHRFWGGEEGVALLGIVNVTPDSFSDGGRLTAASAIAHGLQLLEEGAHWLDIGGESSRPGADPVGVDEELRRVIPVIEGLLSAAPGVRLSVDTWKPEVARAALAAGALAVNDIRGLTTPGMLAEVAAADAGAIVMHMRGDPTTMHRFSDYSDLPGEVAGWLDARARAAVAGGVRRERLAIDPGIGFAKQGAQNLELLCSLGRLAATGWPVVVGASRKRFIGEITGVTEPAQRVYGSVGVALAAAAAGAAILRVHDVAATRQALDTFRACGGIHA